MWSRPTSSSPSSRPTCSARRRSRRARRWTLRAAARSRQLDRGRHHRGAQEHRRRARARPAAAEGLRRWTSTSPTTSARSSAPRASCWPGARASSACASRRGAPLRRGAVARAVRARLARHRGLGDLRRPGPGPSWSCRSSARSWDGCRARAVPSDRARRRVIEHAGSEAAARALAAGACKRRADRRARRLAAMGAARRRLSLGASCGRCRCAGRARRAGPHACASCATRAARGGLCGGGRDDRPHASSRPGGRSGGGGRAAAGDVTGGVDRAPWRSPPSSSACASARLR